MLGQFPLPFLLGRYAGTDVLAVAEKELSAVAEAWSLADDAEGSPSVIRVSKQLQAVVEDIVLVLAWSLADDAEGSPSVIRVR